MSTYTAELMKALPHGRYGTLAIFITYIFLPSPHREAFRVFSPILSIIVGILVIVRLLEKAFGAEVAGYSRCI